MRCSGVLVEVGGTVEDEDFNALFRKENREDEAGRTCANDDDLLRACQMR